MAGLMYWACTEMHVLPSEFLRMPESERLVLLAFFRHWIELRTK